MDGEIVDIPIGNTEIIAKTIQVLSGADLFKIETAKAYPTDYMETTRVAKMELKRDARPDLAALPNNLSAYDTIYMGYPNWWGTFPMAVFTFLESHNFSGKTIVPFCTHEGSGMCGIADIRLLCPKAKVETGIAIRGAHAAKAGAQIENWMTQNINK